MAGEPSSLTKFFDSVVRKPPIAGPKPTQTMSTAMEERSTAAAGSAERAVLTGDDD